MDDPETRWITTEPGRQRLPHTKFAIYWTGRGSFIAEWDGSAFAAAGTIESARRCVADHMRQMLEMGMEP